MVTMSLWKVLAGLLLVVPPVAYVAQDLSTDPQTPTARAAVVLPDEPPPTPGGPGPEPTGPEPTRDPRPSPTPDPDDCDDDERDDGVLVVHPCPDEVGDDEQDDDDRDGGRDDD
jgi:hypothetical protein